MADKKLSESPVISVAGRDLFEVMHSTTLGSPVLVSGGVKKVWDEAYGAGNQANLPATSTVATTGSPPAQVTGLAYTAPNLTWTAVAGATSYEIRIDGGTPSTSTGTALDVSALPAGNHTAQVRGVNTHGAGTYSGLLNFTIAAPSLTQTSLLTTGQSNNDYKSTRPGPYNCMLLDAVNTFHKELGYTNSQPANYYPAANGRARLFHNGTSGQLSTNFTALYAACAKDGSNLLASAAGANVVGGNYWFNDIDVTALTGNPADVAGSLGPLGRAALLEIQAHQFDAIDHSGHASDAALWIQAAPENRGKWKAAFNDMMDIFEEANGKPLWVFINHHGSHNRNTDAGYQILRELQMEIALERPRCRIVTQEAAMERCISREFLNASGTAGSTTITFEGTSGTASSGDQLFGPGIAPNSYIQGTPAFSSGVFTATLDKALIGNVSGKIGKIDDTHKFPSNTGIQQNDFDSDGDGVADRWNPNKGYGRARAAIPAIIGFLNGTVTQQHLGPSVASVTAAGNTVTLHIEYDPLSPATSLRCLDGSPISVDCAGFLRVVADGVKQTITNVTHPQNDRLVLTLSAPLEKSTPVVVGASTYYGAMNKTDFNKTIVDNGPVNANGTPRSQALRMQSPVTDAFMSVTVPAVAAPAESLADVFPEAEAEWSMAKIASYPGSGQKLANLITPFSGASKDAYDLRLGTSDGVDTTDPTFLGTAGQPGARLSLDGGDTIEIIAGNTAFLNALHKTTGGTDWAIAIAMHSGSTLGGYLLSLLNSTTAGDGLRVTYTGGNAIQITQQGGGVSEGSIQLSGALPNDDTVFVLSRRASDGAYMATIGSRTAQRGTWAYRTSTVDATLNFHLFSRSDGSSFVGAGTELFGCYAAKLFIDTDAKLGQLIDYIEADTGKTLA